MTDEQKIAPLREALDDFMNEVQRLRQEHGIKINKILAAIDERKMVELRRQMEQEEQK